MMTKRLLIVLVSAILWLPAATAHRMTERYIPIGMSPGVSGEHSTIGVIQDYDPETHAIVVKGDRGMVTYAMDKRTRIYLDRNKSKRTNLDGSYADCRPGRRVEVMHRFDEEGTAMWVKVDESSN